MKKSTTIALVVAAALLLSGFAAIGVFLGINRGFSLGESIEKTVIDSYEIATEEISPDFERISIIESEAEVELIRVTGDTARVEYSIVQDRDYIITVDGGVLDIRVDDRRSHFSGFNVIYRKMTLRVYLPESEYESLFIDSSSGSISVPAGFSFGEAQIGSTSGSISLDADVTGSADVKATSGSVRLAGIHPQSMAVECTSGSITVTDAGAGNAQINSTSGSIKIRGGQYGSLAAAGSSGSVSLSGIAADSISAAAQSGSLTVESCSAAGNMDAACSSGTIRFINCTAGTLSAQSSSGSITLERTVVIGLARLKNSSGGVRFDMADAGELDVETSSGSVRGSLLTGKLFDVRTNSGSENVPESDRDGGMCTINTTSGSVKITVAE